MKFSDRLKQALDAVKVEWGPTTVGRALGVPKQTADQWMGSSAPRSDGLFAVVDKLRELGVPEQLRDPRWLATGEREPHQAPQGADPLEMEILARYRAADPRWQLSLRLLAALATEEQIEAATDVNVIVARIVGKKPSDVRYALNERVAEAYGTPPGVRERTTHTETRPTSETFEKRNSAQRDKSKQRP